MLTIPSVASSHPTPVGEPSFASRVPHQLVSRFPVQPTLTGPKETSKQSKYTSGTKAVNITVSEERQGISVPSHMKFNYVPSLGSALTHEVAGDRNQRIKDFRRCSWLLPTAPMSLSPQRMLRPSAMWLVTRAKRSKPQGTRKSRRRWTSASSPDGRYVPSGRGILP